MERGFKPEMGARAMQRAVQELVEEPLSVTLISGEFAAGAHLRVVVEEDSTRFERVEPLGEERSHAT
jgi:ATP-dependent Clp protease ATP-binding subunit ClpB